MDNIVDFIPQYTQQSDFNWKKRPLVRQGGTDPSPGEDPGSKLWGGGMIKVSECFYLTSALSVWRTFVDISLFQNRVTQATANEGEG